MERSKGSAKSSPPQLRRGGAKRRGGAGQANYFLDQHHPSLGFASALPSSAEEGSLFPARLQPHQLYLFIPKANARLCLLPLLACVFFLATTTSTNAHKPVTSKYDYNSDVFPLLKDHCSQCHVEGGAGPMSLMTY